MICLLILIILIYFRFYFNLNYFFLYDFSSPSIGKFFINGIVTPGLKESEILSSRFTWQDIIFHGDTIPKPADVEQPTSHTGRELAKLSREELWQLYLKNFNTSINLNIKDKDHFGYIYGHQKFTTFENRHFNFERCYKMFPEMIIKDSDTQISLEAEKAAIWKKLKFPKPPSPLDVRNSGATVWMKQQPNWKQLALERWELNQQIVADQYKDGVFPPIISKYHDYTEEEKKAKARMLITYVAKRLLLGSKHGMADDVVRAQLQMSKWDDIDDHYGQLTTIFVIVYPIMFLFIFFYTTIINFIFKYFYEVRFSRGAKYFIKVFSYYLKTSIKPHTEEYMSLANDAINELKRCRELQAHNLSEEDLKILLKKLSNFLFYCNNHPLTHELIDSELLEPLKRYIPIWSDIADYNDFFKKNPNKFLISRILSFKWFRFSTSKRA